MSNPQAALPIVKVTSITDIGVHLVDLPEGTYQIDGEIVQGSSGFNSYNTKKQVSVKDVNDIRLVTKKNVLTHYEDNNGSTISVGIYNEELNLLCGSCVTVDDDELYFDTLEEEFAYRKFKQRWMPVYRTDTTISEPLGVDKTELVQDTGNPFIVAGFLTGAADAPLYSYSRTRAMKCLVHQKFKSLGMEYHEGINYSRTEGQKVYGNSTHSHLEYLTAFGKYIIGKDLVKKTVGEFKGSLDYLEKMYNEDKRWIDDHIQTLYNLHFRNEDASGVLLSEVYEGVKTAITWVSTMDVKQKSETSKRSVLQKMEKLLELVNREVLEK
jgi:hypothetical protein